MDQLWQVVKSIPPGRCAGYGDVGAALDRPISGLLVGRFLRNSPDDVPWWRVVGKHGDLLIGKQSPHLAQDQAERLAAEGVTLVNGVVPMSTYGYVP
jgi:methylated-DNA-protein-cysteine methyltransferase-like protein